MIFLIQILNIKLIFLKLKLIKIVLVDHIQKFNANQIIFVDCFYSQFNRQFPLVMTLKYLILTIL